jgi:3'-phosphoadenosine 5'-phosphosulfate sulfotransferase (PAPS reductase)/FAD synthetase
MSVATERKFNPYFINEPAAISFSGGRTSAYMLYKILEAHDGKLPDDVRVTFANTGKEMPETLDFVQACSDHWGVDIVWLEYAGRSLKPKEEKKSVYEYSYKVVNHKTASRNGEPFTRVIQDVGMLPDPRHRWCTGQLKINTMKRYLIDENFDLPFLCLIGLRADEPMRVAKIHGKIKEGQENYCPMYVSGESKQDVFEFWETQNFDLNLPNNKGVTDWGNCDLCFLKSKSKKLSIMRERPDLAQWWVDIEKKDKVDVFNRSHGSYEQMQIIATDQGQLFDFDDDPSIPCFCGD